VRCNIFKNVLECVHSKISLTCCTVTGAVYIGFEEHFGLEMSSESDVSDVSSLSSDDYALSDKLSVWAVNHNIPKGALSDLLHLPNPHVPGLPLDARTLLKSENASKYNVNVITRGSYCHFGVLNGIKKLDDGLDISSGSNDGKCLQLQVNVDGLPVYKSTNYQGTMLTTDAIGAHSLVSG